MIARLGLRAGAGLVAGALVAVSLPPFGLWPLAPLGIAVLTLALGSTTVRARALVGFLFGVGQFGIGLYFIVQFTLAGYFAALVIESIFFVLAALLSPAPGMVVIFFSLASLAREHWPFHGVPLGSIWLGQASSPLGQLARLAGPLGITLATIATGVALGLFARVTLQRSKDVRQLLWPIGTLGIVVCCAVLATQSSRGVKDNTTLRVAAVQGGGPRGTRAIETPAIDATERSMQASFELHRGLDLVLWPENTVLLPAHGGRSSISASLSRLAATLRSTLVVGVTERVGASHFINEALAYGPRGNTIGRVEKVHPVPFGEYVPLRSLLGHIVSLDAVPLDAIAGDKPEVLEIAGHKAGFLISYEAFFPDLARADVRNGAAVILVPTNTASYRSDQAPAEELAASRIDAIATGRAVLQAATTGYSALIDTGGAVSQQTKLGEMQVVVAHLSPRGGNTLFDRVGDWPLLVALLLAAAGAGAGRVSGFRRSRTARGSRRQARMMRPRRLQPSGV